MILRDRSRSTLCKRIKYKWKGEANVIQRILGRKLANAATCKQSGDVHAVWGNGRERKGKTDGKGEKGRKNKGDVRHAIYVRTVGSCWERG